MKQELYVLAVETADGLFYLRNIEDGADEYEAVSSDRLAEALMLEDLDTCKKIIEVFEREANFKIHKIELKEVKV